MVKGRENEKEMEGGGLSSERLGTLWFQPLLRNESDDSQTQRYAPQTVLPFIIIIHTTVIFFKFVLSLWRRQNWTFARKMGLYFSVLLKRPFFPDR